jgi:fused signal recognition particle receptor
MVIGTLFAGRKRIDDDLMEELETLLITADVGVSARRRASWRIWRAA